MKAKLTINKEVTIDLEDFREHIEEVFNEEVEEDEEPIKLENIPVREVKHILDDLLADDINAFSIDLDETDITVEVTP